MVESTDLVILGGGLGGLTAAALAAKAGLAVTVLEKANELGGRAATTQKHGFSLSLGAPRSRERRVSLDGAAA